MDCPYHYEVREGRLFIEGEDFGEAESAFAQGEKLLAFTRVLHEIAMEGRGTMRPVCPSSTSCRTSRRCD